MPVQQGGGDLAGGAYEGVRGHDKRPRTPLVDFFNILLGIRMPISETPDGRVAIIWDLSQVKSVYRSLFAQLRADPGADVDDGDCLLELQMFLQRKAGEDGVDVTHHQAWEAWLGHETPIPCDQRYAKYRPNGEDPSGQGSSP
jgi:hypothetical protein